MNISILTYNNKVGIVTDAMLLKKILEEIHVTTSIIFIDKIQSVPNNDVGIWIQDFDYNYLNEFKKNILYINEEWYCRDESELDVFDYVICKNSYAYELLKHRSNIVYIPFLSKNMYDPTIQKDNKLLHFVGRSIQKNTEVILNLRHNITFIDPDDKWSSKIKIPDTFEHITSYLSDDTLKYHLNNKSTHLCCSLYESWGHYAFEGLSTGAHLICSDIPVFRDQLDPSLVTFIPTYDQPTRDFDYWYGNDIERLTYPFRKAYYINELELDDIINHQLKYPDNKQFQRISLFNKIVETNTKLITTFFKNI